jgi:hypothetical protein
MAKLTKADAARHLGIARSTLYKLINQGKVSPTPDGLVDQAELVRVAAYVDTLKERLRTSADSHEIPAPPQAETPYGRPRTNDRERSQTAGDERPQTSSDVLVDILREQLHVLREELQEARQSAQAARDREARLLHLCAWTPVCAHGADPAAHSEWRLPSVRDGTATGTAAGAAPGTSVGACCGMGWCSGWAMGGMWQPRRQGMSDNANIHYE